MLKHFSKFLWYSHRRWLYVLLSLVCCVSIAIAKPLPSYGVPWIELFIRGAQIYQLSNISETQESQLGQEINQQLISSGRAPISSNQTITNYINEIGQRLAKTSERPKLKYTFQVVNDNGINAFATMGGYVYVNLGLIKKASNEAELASVIGHEIGHIVGRHAIQQMRQQAISQGVLTAAGLNRSAAVQIGVELALSRPNSREDELEADQLGLVNLKKAGYAPSGMISFMEKLLQKGGSVPNILSTHPATSDRIKALDAKVDPQTANVGMGLDSQAYKNRISSIL
ncbi:peptidase M48 Ste24p [Stanieria cyanosphaera PCC 7437]|uniref:Peptidase M48 Ste24p n=1 Tax=Stanieria cyanosphaera (strain ATCC 29371 / PCC 7437) TaxID=111780 RepID=K9XRC8_STAC7|nr:M48 family metallopeptidase [Stanieria cyanosphaera]AFZ34639.1 peptidase M48 Ste24p [Stanieria cyanosphaera PCC 7437]